MKNYFKGFFLLVLLSVGVFYGVMKSQNIFNNAKNVLIALKNKSANNKAIYESMQQGLFENSQIMETLDTFSESWDKHLVNSNDPSKMLSDLIELSFENALVVSEKSEQRTKINEKGIQKESILIKLKVLGKFECIYAWLGAIEEAYPLAKINEFDLRAENMNAALILGLHIPILI